MFSDFRFGHLGYWVSALAIAVLGVALHVVSTQVQRSWRDEAGVADALQALTEFSDAASEAESAHRGWVISRAPELEDDRDRALASARAALERLRRQLAGDEPSSIPAAELASLFDQRREVMRRGEAMRRLGEPPAAARIAIASAAREAMGRVRRKRDELRALLATRAAAGREAERFATEKAQRVLVFGGLLMILVLAPTYAAFVREAAARKRAEDLLRDLTENLPGAVFSLRAFPDRRLRFEFVSGNIEAVRGVSREAALGDAHAVVRTIHADDRPRVIEILQRAAEDVQPVRFSYRLAGPEERWLQTTAQPRPQRDGSVLWHGHWEDITAKQRLEAAIVHAKERAEAANRAKSRFLATMSHEIRTPMNGVLGMLELVCLGPLQPDQRASLAVVRESGAALMTIIDDILDFSKMEAGKLDLRPEPANLGAIVSRVADLYSAIAAKKGVALERRIDPGLHGAHLADAVRLQQVLANLVSNALKFTDRGRVEITAALESRDGDRDIVRFSVLDTGTGIAAVDLARLFTPFVQSQGAPCRVPGTGLGLSICRGLAQLMGGSLALESEPGQGTRATFVVPLERSSLPDQAHRPASRTLATTAPAAAGAVPRVLVVDDHPVNRLVLERQLSLLGYAAETAEGGEEALERMARGDIDGLLVDVNMPGIDGYVLARLVRERERREGIPRTVMIACTANAFRGDAEMCLQSGMDDYVAKPVDLEGLGQVLHRWLPLPRARALHG